MRSKHYPKVVARSLYSGVGIMLVRAGGGGSSSGGSSSGGGSSSSFSHSTPSGSSTTNNMPPWAAWMLGTLLLVFFTWLIYRMIKDRNVSEEETPAMKANLAEAGKYNPLFEEGLLRKRTEEVFLAFQQSWMSFDVEGIKDKLEYTYWVKIVLILNILRNLNRQNRLSNIHIDDIVFTKVNAAEGTFTAAIDAGMDDELVSLEDGRTIHKDTSDFREYWNFMLKDGGWILAGIDQESADETKQKQSIAAFAVAHSFYYDLDFGRLLIPEKGELFSEAAFGRSDLNNHVVGYYKEKIIEFFTYEPLANDHDRRIYTVAQAILPRSRFHVLVNRKELFSLPRRDMRKLELESPDFNRQFSVWADSRDALSGFELLDPAFMEKIMGLPFEVNIEIIGNTLYVYTDSGTVEYEEMLNILSWAFDEMKV